MNISEAKNLILLISTFMPISEPSGIVNTSKIIYNRIYRQSLKDG